MPNNAKCPTCAGMGILEGSNGRNCWACGGSGLVYEITPAQIATMQDERTDTPLTAERVAELREKAAKAIKTNARHHLERRGSHGVYHWSGVDRAVDEILALTIAEAAAGGGGETIRGLAEKLVNRLVACRRGHGYVIGTTAEVDALCEALLRAFDDPTPPATIPTPAPAGEGVETLARWLCAFAKMDPDEPISDGGHSVIDWVKHYDVPKLLALVPAALSPSPEPTADVGGELREKVDTGCGFIDCVSQCGGDYTHETCPQNIARKAVEAKGRDVREAAARVAAMDDMSVQLFAARDPDIFRDIARALAGKGGQ